MRSTTARIWAMHQRQSASAAPRERRDLRHSWCHPLEAIGHCLEALGDSRTRAHNRVAHLRRKGADPLLPDRSDLLPAGAMSEIRRLLGRHKNDVGVVAHHILRIELWKGSKIRCQDIARAQAC